MYYQKEEKMLMWCRDPYTLSTWFYYLTGGNTWFHFFVSVPATLTSGYLTYRCEAPKVPDICRLVPTCCQSN